jgi:SpoVK/Ycf46/Vps4 family AAA+-type ATPase
MNGDETSPNFLQWMVQDRGTYQACGHTIRRLPAGAYTPVSDCYGNIRFQARDLRVDDLIDFTDSLPSRILHAIVHFWDLGDRFRRYGFLHRRGYLFYGKQGSGKSSLIHQIIARVVGRGHLAFFAENPAVFVGALEIFRKVEPDRPIVCVFEDIDAIVKVYGDTYLLQWLDGNHQVDRAVNLASTNYPERLDRRIIARPRRFDRILRIDSPEAPLRAAYFAAKMPHLPAEERERWVDLSEGLPFAALAELVISVQCLGHDLEEAVELLKSLDTHEPSSGEFATNGVADGEE